MKAVALVLIALGTTVVADNEKLCECGVFSNETPEKTTEVPLIVKSPTFPIDCKTDGKENCAKMCIALAETSRDKGPAMLCQLLLTRTTPYTPSIYSRACGEQEWTRTDLATGHVRICCVNQTPVACPEPQTS